MVTQKPYKPKLDALLKAGVRTFIDLTECGELSPYSSILSGRAELLGIEPKTIEYYNFPIRDRYGNWLLASSVRNCEGRDEALQIIAKEWSTVEKCKRFLIVQRPGLNLSLSNVGYEEKSPSAATRVEVYPFKALQLVFIALLLGFMFFFMTALGRL
ncbi:hypothetical protein BDP27DRAFT_1370710 [Rhodocollybia butyracea]|uniref:Uncharacterized protein n=1 Tax=Rhodocollybia butyracea TaxID=206335 RepID=A0A9P5PDT8_9AGAR|nr:hypothetical protein BDP27DRAFT_1370710 [Rhodocollybia butyracea]